MRLAKAQRVANCKKEAEEQQVRRVARELPLALLPVQTYDLRMDGIRVCAFRQKQIHRRAAGEAMCST